MPPVSIMKHHAMIFSSAAFFRSTSAPFFKSFWGILAFRVTRQTALGIRMGSALMTAGSQRRRQRHVLCANGECVNTDKRTDGRPAARQWTFTRVNTHPSLGESRRASRSRRRAP